MIITYYDKQFIRIQLGDTVLAVNPIGKGSKFPSARFGADIALVSVPHPDYNGVENVTYGEKEPFVISCPGEYEVNGVYVKGMSSETQLGKDSYINTVYRISLEQMHVVVLGALASNEVSPEVYEGIGEDVDILITPVGDGDLLTPSAAHKFATKLGAKIIIPVDTDAAMLKTFLKEAGAEGVKATEKATLKKKDVSAMEGEVIVLKTTK
ncbi:MAG: MBL fold metallo-hydrolase [Parcubacteria group bacterium]|nr:MBL fold metallo-hydrolase [Parcubacteria group bacterium]